MVSRALLRVPVVRISLLKQAHRGSVPLVALRFKSDPATSSSDTGYDTPNESFKTNNPRSGHGGTALQTEKAKNQDMGDGLQPVSEDDASIGATGQGQFSVGEIHQPADKPAGDNTPED